MPAQADAKHAVEERTRHWLEANYLAAVASLPDASRRVFDAAGQPQHLTAYAFQELHRKLKIFRWLERFEFESFIDVGAGFDWYPDLVRERYGARAYFADFAHSMNLPYAGSESGRLDHAVTLNIARLPFADDSFDAVLSSEVLEHLVRPVEAIGELLRISRRYLVMTSLEALSVSRWQRLLSHLRVDVREPHVERNFFLLPELQALFGEDWSHENLFHDASLPVTSFAPLAAQDAVYGRLRDAGALADALAASVSVTDHRPGSMGILIVKTKPGAPLRSATGDVRELARWLIDRTAAGQARLYALADQIRAGTAPLTDRQRPIAAELLALIRCPDCRGALQRRDPGLFCPACRSDFPVEYGVPMLYPMRSREHAPPGAEWLEGSGGADAERSRIVTRVAQRLRRNEQPPGPLRRLLWRLDRSLTGGLKH